MKLLEKILMPIDVNDINDEQIGAAVKIAKEFHSEVLVMYVLPDSDLHPDVEKLLSKYINKTINKTIKALKKEDVVCPDPIIKQGNPVSNILEVATDENANLILVSSGANVNEDRFKLGTTAEKLVQLSDVPVWVTQYGEELKMKRILCPIDFSDPAKRALRNAILLSNNFNATLHILGVFEPFFTASPRINFDQKAENEKLRKQFEVQMDEFLSGFSLKGLNHKVEIAVGVPHDKILKAIDKSDIDMLVIGTNGRSGFSRMLLGSVTEKVIRELPCSFVTTKTQNIYQLRLDDEVKNIEAHFSNAEKLQKSGLHKEAIEQYLVCLQINDMHVPSMFKLAKLYKTIGNEEKMKYYEDMAGDILRRLWDKKIEFEIRNHYRTDL